MILIVIFLIILYYIIKINTLETMNIKKNNLSDIFNYDIEDNNTNNINKMSFYSNTWYGNNYFDKNDNKIKNLYPNNYIDINPKINNEETIDYKNFNKTDKIKDVYDKLVYNYKNYDKKKIIDINDTISSSVSNVAYYNPNTWIYENENINNGGFISDNLTAYDNMTEMNVGIF